MKIGIIYSRRFDNYSLLKEIIFKNINIDKIDCIISGGIEDVDNFGEKLAKEYNKRIKIFFPNWEVYGLKADFIKNSIVVKESDVVFVFGDENSSGIVDVIEKTLKAKKPLVIVNYSEQENNRIKKFNFDLLEETL